MDEADFRHRYHLSKPQADSTTELHLTPLERIDRIAALVSPPWVHRHRYHGVLAPNSPLHARVTALAREATTTEAAPTNASSGTNALDQISRSSARDLWVMLIVRLPVSFFQWYRRGGGFGSGRGRGPGGGFGHGPGGRC